MRRANAGFTLLESLVALAILSTIVLAVGQSLTQSARAGSAIVDRRAALDVATRIMETEISNLSGRPASGQENGIVWEVERKAWKGDDTPGLLEVTVRAFPAASPAAGATFSTLVANR